MILMWDNCKKKNYEYLFNSYFFFKLTKLENIWTVFLNITFDAKHFYDCLKILGFILQQAIKLHFIIEQFIILMQGNISISFYKIQVFSKIQKWKVKK